MHYVVEFDGWGQSAMCRWIILGVIFLLAVPLGALAGAFEDGAAAYGRGDYKAAYSAWAPLAQNGNPTAQFNLGILYDQGKGVAQNRGEASTWYRRAAELGDIRAAFNLGSMLVQGDGGEKKSGEAIKWFRMAADKGDVLAQFVLGRIHEEGLVVARDYGEAAKWYLLAAEKEHNGAQTALGTLYANGQGVERDLGKANDWLARADNSLMMGESNTSCTTQRSALMLEQCRRVVPRM